MPALAHGICRARHLKRNDLRSKLLGQKNFIFQCTSVFEQKIWQNSNAQKSCKTYQRIIRAQSQHAHLLAFDAVCKANLHWAFVVAEWVQSVAALHWSSNTPVFARMHNSTGRDWKATCSFSMFIRTMLLGLRMSLSSFSGAVSSKNFLVTAPCLTIPSTVVQKASSNFPRVGGGANRVREVARRDAKEVVD